MDVREKIKLLNKRRNELKEQEKELFDESSKLFSNMEELVTSGKFSEEQIKEKWEECYFKEDVLLEKRKVIKEEMTKVSKKLCELRGLMDSKSKLEGKKVDLYRRGIEEYYYDVCLHGTKEVIGHVGYRGKLDKICKGSTGNIGYYIAKQHRRNGYMSEALQILTDKLYKDGIKEIYIAIDPSNIASIRVAEKIGGKLMNKVSSDFSVVYKCDLEIIKKNKMR